MYQNMDCVVYGYGMFTSSVEFAVLNAANEKIENPVYVFNGEQKFGVMVPYGGYLNIQPIEGVTLHFNDCNSGYNFTSILSGNTSKIKVVRDYYVRVITESTSSIDNQVV